MQTQNSSDAKPKYLILALASAPFPALYYHFKMYFNSMNVNNMSQWW